MQKKLRPTLLAVLTTLTVLASLPAHAILKVYTVSREEFYVYRSPESGQARELTFSTLPPGMHGPSTNVLPVEARAFHENYLLIATVGRVKNRAEVNIKNYWSYYVSSQKYAYSNVSAKQTQIDQAKLKIRNLKVIMNDPDLAPNQREQVGQEITNAENNITSLERDLKYLQGQKDQTCRNEDSEVKMYTDSLAHFRAELDKAYDDTTYYVVIASDDSWTANLGFGLEGIATKGFCTKDASGTENCEFGAPPAETNAWDKFPGFPNLNLNIDRQGETRP